MERRKSELRLTRAYIFAILLGIILCILTLLMFPSAHSYEFSNLQVGDVYIGEEIIAPFDFPINKTPAQLEKDIEEAKNRVYPVFVRNDSILNAQSLWLEGFIFTIQAIRDSAINENKKIEILTDFLKSYNIIISDENLFSLLTTKNSLTHRETRSNQRPQNTLFPFEKEILELNKELYSIGILNVKKSNITHGEGKCSVIYKNEEIIEKLDFYYDLDDAKQFLKTRTDKLIENGQTQFGKVGYQILVAFLVPNIIYNNAETDLRIQQAIRSVPSAIGIVRESERIIDNHERVTEEHLQQLKSLAQERADQATEENNLQQLLPWLGRFLIVLFAFSILGLFIFVRRREFLYKFKLIFLIFLILLFVIFLCFILNNLGLSGYLMPITIASMLLTIFFDIEFGFVSTVSLSIIIGALRGSDFDIIVVCLLAGVLAVASVHNVRSRNWLLTALLLIMGIYALSIAALEFLHYATFMKAMTSVGFGLINGLISPIMVYGLTVIIESAFDLTTDMKLLELSDLNKPLLKELAMKAPGTYFHSVVVGNLSEAAAEAIGANSLLARVGAYYHDIGKVINPRYFIENQDRGSLNPHEKLSPNISALILVSHVRKGVELAKKYKLPGVIIDFIAQHHGTNIMNSFYQKAVQQNKKSDKKVIETDFRYLGPRPRTKETGIVMLADIIEATSRTFKDPTVSRIKAMVNSIIHERFLQSELDDCPLTLSDLNRIGESFQKILIGIFHARIEYPDQEDKFFKKNKFSEKEK
ncbi:HDIG domain-containing protein [candidate division KSB1 bacterium]|nr:HDIG domain-containing protein [candidate division KSB1 bacterium]